MKIGIIGAMDEEIVELKNSLLFYHIFTKLTNKFSSEN